MALRLETVFLLVFGWAFAASTQAASSQSLGVVLLHGKQGTPAQMQGLRNSLEATGFLRPRLKCAGRAAESMIRRT